MIINKGCNKKEIANELRQDLDNLREEFSSQYNHTRFKLSPIQKTKHYLFQSINSTVKLKLNKSIKERSSSKESLLELEKSGSLKTKSPKPCDIIFSEEENLRLPINKKFEISSTFKRIVTERKNKGVEEFSRAKIRYNRSVKDKIIKSARKNSHTIDLSELGGSLRKSAEKFRKEGKLSKIFERPFYEEKK